MPIDTNPPRRMEQHDKIKMRAAAHKVQKLLPGPLGEIVGREIMIWEEFGYRLGSGSLIFRAVDEIMKTPLPPAEPLPPPSKGNGYRPTDRLPTQSAVGYGG